MTILAILVGIMMIQPKGASAELPPPPTPIATVTEPFIIEEVMIEETSYAKTCVWYIKETDGSDIGWFKIGMTGTWLTNLVKGTSPKSSRAITDYNYKWIYVQDNFDDFPTNYQSYVLAWREMKLKYIPSGATWHWIFGIAARGSTPNKMTCSKSTVTP